VAVQAAILAGGLATRLRPLTDDVPKAMLDTGSRPFLDHQLALLRRGGVRDVVVCVGRLGERIRSYFGDGRDRELRIVYSDDGPRPLGTAGCLRAALPLLHDWFFVVYGDSYVRLDYAAIGADFARAGASAAVVVHHNRNRWDASNILLADGRVREYRKAARGEPSPFEHIDAGVLLFRREVFERLPPDVPVALDGEVVPELVASGSVLAYEARARFYEIGSPGGLEEFRAFAAAGGTA
jgi:N-acetyl-alpha-D-muramate 1-phosphate uridylyltransferase